MKSVLGVKIDNLDRREIVQKLEFILNKENKESRQVVTVNPEFVLEAQKNKKFREILNSKSTLSIADGIGLKFASWRYGWNLKQRWAGIDLMMEILKIANKNKQRVFLIANKNGLSSWEETAEAVKGTYPNLKIVGVNVSVDSSGNDLRFKIYDLRRNILTVHKLKAHILNHKSELVFCSLGAPYQEILLNHFCKGPTFAPAKVQPSQKPFKNPRLVMGVGGSFDFLTGKIKRAPKWMRIIGLEWLYRFLQEPKYRMKRIYRAVIVFPIRIIFSK